MFKIKFGVDIMFIMYYQIPLFYIQTHKKCDFCVFKTLNIIFLAFNLTWGFYCHSLLYKETKNNLQVERNFIIFNIVYVLHIQVNCKLFKFDHRIKSRELFTIVILQVEIQSKSMPYCA